MALAKNSLQDLDLLEEQIIFYRQHLDIFIEDAFAPLKLTKTQKVIIRQFGNCIDLKATCSRGYGKTFVAALGSAGLCCLYPGTKVVIVSATAKQAILTMVTLKSIVDQNANLANEIRAGNARNLIQIQGDSAKCTFKNGSVMESVAIESARGRRAKIVVVDEALDVDQEKLESIVAPLRNETRYNSRTYGFPDFPQKTITITSACGKNNPYYEKFLDTIKAVGRGDKSVFACSLDYRTAAADGITDMDYFMREKERQPDLTFQTEYGSKFIGAENNSAFPFDLTQSCRTLKRVELEQPKNSKSRYVISLDIATSEAKDADNSIITVLKFTERNDGTFLRKVVLIRSFHGEKLDKLVEELRILYHLRFPNTEKIIYDARGLGDSLDRFFDKEWIDISGKEYPPLVVDDIPATTGIALPVLHPFRAVQSLNQRLYTNLRVALEKKRIEIPVTQSFVRQVEADDELKQLSMEEKAVFLEADTLQYEMGNIVARISQSGNVLYDTPPRHSLHKDRYSSLAMANDYVSEIEKETMKRYSRGSVCVGLATSF